MAGKQFKLSIIVDATTASATKGLGGLGKTLGKLGLAAAGVGTAIVGGLAVAGGAVAKLAIDAAPLQGIEEAFKGIAEASGKSSEEMLLALRAGSQGMVAQRDLMTSYNLAAQLVSDTFANRLPNAMGYLGKIAAATGEDMGFMMDSLVRGVGRLSPMILDNLGIQVDVTAANEAYAESLGKSAKELTKTEQQTALMNQVMEKLAANTASMPDILGKTSTNIAMLKTRLVDFKDRIGKAVLPIFHEFLQVIGDLAMRALPKIAEAVEKMAGKFAKFAQKVLPVFLEGLRKVWIWIIGIAIPQLKLLGLALTNFVIPVFNFFRSKVLPGLFKKATEFWAWITQTAIPVLMAWGRALLEILGPAFEQVQKLVGGAARAIEGGWPAIWEKLKEWGRRFWDWITEIAIPAAREKLKELGATFLTWLVESWPKFKERLKRWGRMFWDWIKEVAIPLAKEKLGELRDYIVKWPTETWPGIKTQLVKWGKAFWGWVTETAIPLAREKLGELATAIWTWLEENHPELALKLEGWAETFGELWLDVQTSFGVFMEGFQPKLDEMYETLMEFVDFIQPELLRTWEILKVAWDEIKITADVLGETFGLLTGMIFGTKTQFGELVGALLGFGLDILIGLITLAVEGLNAALSGAIVLMAIFQASAAGVKAGLGLEPSGGINPWALTLPGLPGFQFGGTMPGSPSQAGLAVLHGGETVTPAGRGGGVRIEGEALQLLRTMANKENIIVVETSDGGATRDHILGLGDRAWALPSGA